MKHLIAIALAVALAGPLSAQDRYQGYYFPQITSQEVFDRVVRSGAGANKAVRIDFVNTLTNAQLESVLNPNYVFYTKGNDAGTLILTALDDEVFATIYRARAIMAQLTVSVRTGGFFVEEELQYVATFYDLLQLLEFDELIITDGKTWSHKVDFKR